MLKKTLRTFRVLSFETITSFFIICFFLFPLLYLILFDDLSVDQIIKRRASFLCEKRTQHRYQRFIRTDFKLNYSNSSTYHGPIVKGWGPNVSRDIDKYVPKQKGFFTILPRAVNLETTELLIIIKTRVDGLNNRMDVRQSWLKTLKGLKKSAATVFLVGKKEGSVDYSSLKNESKKYGDIIQGNFVDSYFNLTLKTIATHKFVIETEWVNRPKMIITLDDDVFVNAPLLLKTVDDLNQRCEGPYYVGGLLQNNVVQTDPEDKEFSHKAGVPSYMYKANTYPPYISGLICLMSYETVQCFNEETYNLPYFHIEDVFRGFAAQRCGIPAKNQPGFHISYVNSQTFNTSYHIVNLKTADSKAMYKAVKLHYNLKD
ncbi:beta-1,3-galactosyltransferase 5 [Lepeophtheirus salmonis]|uniref:beta-1,3-galactosyltransferase 5 n=1 Tax=Lepeophtheirus salmonis TaxID=72036 RepID=UPI001AE3BC2A|nr:beta-1,3-galactosyltransferase 5-like [Lepeophtheirus salmonis]